MELTRYCTHCGAKSDGKTAFCETCGSTMTTQETVDNPLSDKTPTSSIPTEVQQLDALGPTNGFSPDRPTPTANPRKVWAIILVVAVIVGSLAYLKPWAGSDGAESNGQANSQDQSGQNPDITATAPVLFQGDPAEIPSGTLSVSFPSYTAEVGYNICKDPFPLGEQILTPAVADNSADARSEDYQKVVKAIRRGLASVGTSQTGDTGDPYIRDTGGFDIDAQNAITRYQENPTIIDGKTEPARYIRLAEEPLIGPVLWNNMKGWLTRYNHCQSYK